MKLKTVRKDKVVKAGGSPVATALDSGIALTLMIQQYTRQVMASFRELCTNAADSQGLAGEVRPFDIRLNRSPAEKLLHISVRDYGVSMSDEFMLKEYFSVGRSTKRESQSSNGTFGIGAKAVFGVASTVRVLTFDGCRRREYLGYLSEDGQLCVQRLSEVESSEPMGVDVQYAINLEDDREVTLVGDAGRRLEDEQAVLKRNLGPGAYSLYKLDALVGGGGLLWAILPVGHSRSGAVVPLVWLDGVLLDIPGFGFDGETFDDDWYEMEYGLFIHPSQQRYTDWDAPVERDMQRQRLLDTLLNQQRSERYYVCWHNVLYEMGEASSRLPSVTRELTSPRHLRTVVLYAGDEDQLDITPERMRLVDSEQNAEICERLARRVVDVIHSNEVNYWTEVFGGKLPLAEERRRYLHDQVSDSARKALAEKFGEHMLCSDCGSLMVYAEQKFKTTIQTLTKRLAGICLTKRYYIDQAKVLLIGTRKQVEEYGRTEGFHASGLLNWIDSPDSDLAEKVCQFVNIFSYEAVKLTDLEVTKIKKSKVVEVGYVTGEMRNTRDYDKRPVSELGRGPDRYCENVLYFRAHGGDVISRRGLNYGPLPHLLNAVRNQFQIENRVIVRSDAAQVEVEKLGVTDWEAWLAGLWKKAAYDTRRLLWLRNMQFYGEFLSINGYKDCENALVRIAASRCQTIYDLLDITKLEWESSKIRRLYRYAEKIKREIVDVRLAEQFLALHVAAASSTVSYPCVEPILITGLREVVGRGEVATYFHRLRLARQRVTPTHAILRKLAHISGRSRLSSNLPTLQISEEIARCVRVIREMLDDFDKSRRIVGVVRREVAERDCRIERYMLAQLAMLYRM